MKALKVKTSGTFINRRNEIEDYQGVEGVMPFVEDDGIVLSALRGKYMQYWLRDKGFNVKSIREVYIDSIEETEKDFSYVGKNINDLSLMEIQDLAVAKELLIPSKGGLAYLRKRAYMAMYNHLFKTNLTDVDQIEGLTEEIVINKKLEKKPVKVITPEKSIEMEIKSINKEKYTLDDLKTILDKKGIKYHHRAGFDKLYELAFK